MNVIMMALLEEKMEIEFWDARNDNIDELIEQLDSQECVGALLNTSAGSHGFLVAAIIRCLEFCFGKNGHWIAIRKVTSGNVTKYVDLDSKHKTPQDYGDKRLREFLDSHVRAKTSILLAKKMI